MTMTTKDANYVLQQMRNHSLDTQQIPTEQLLDDVVEEVIVPAFMRHPDGAPEYIELYARSIRFLYKKHEEVFYMDGLLGALKLRGFRVKMKQVCNGEDCLQVGIGL